MKRNARIRQKDRRWVSVEEVTRLSGLYAGLLEAELVATGSRHPDDFMVYQMQLHDGALFWQFTAGD